MIYWQLFLSFLQVGLFAIGGGYAAIPLIQDQVTVQHEWLSLTQFTDLVTIAEMTPGAIAINAATFVGTQIAGFPGALIATFGCIVPALVIVSTLAWIYYKFRNMKGMKAVLDGLRPAVVAMIASAGLTILILAFWNVSVSDFVIGNAVSTINWISVVLFILSFILLRRGKQSPIKTMIVAGVIGMIVYQFVPLP